METNDKLEFAKAMAEIAFPEYNKAHSRVTVAQPPKSELEQFLEDKRIERETGMTREEIQEQLDNDPNIFTQEIELMAFFFPDGHEFYMNYVSVLDELFINLN